jgi:ankyrin repeat protein
LAVNAGSRLFEVLKGDEKDDKTELEGGTSVNCLALAAWIGDKTLVESYNVGLDPPSFFGRPSWAAAAQGHAEIIQFFLDQGALPYEPTFVEGPAFNLAKSPLGVAAYMGHENITRLYVQPSYYCPEVRHEEETAIYYAAQGNQPMTLKYLLEHYKQNSTHQEFLSEIDGALVWSCRVGAPLSFQILLDYGADVNESDTVPRSCLQLAAVANNVQIVQMLLDAGASLEPDKWIHRRTSTRPIEKPKRQKSALAEAKLRDNKAIVELLEERQRKLDGSHS